MTPPERPGPSSASAPSLSQFQDEHDRMMAMFRTYQCGLMSLNLVEARCGLVSLRYALAVHMRVEDEVLMPLYMGLEHQPEGGAPLFFEKEHAKLERLLKGLFAGLEGLERIDKESALTREDALLVIEHGFTFKHLFEHHTSREDKAFYPAINASLSPAERQQAWQRMGEVEAQTRASLGEPPSRADVT